MHFEVESALSSRTPSDILKSQNDNDEAIDFLFRSVEAGIFDQMPPAK